MQEIAGIAGKEVGSWLLCSLLSLTKKRVWKSLLASLLSLAEGIDFGIVMCVNLEMKINKINFGVNSIYFKVGM